MDPENLKELGGASGDGAAEVTHAEPKDDQSSSELQAAPHQRKYRTKAWEGIEEQIALDSFFSGESERPFMELMASADGLDLKQGYLLSSGPWRTPPEEAEVEYTFIGAVDQLVDLEKHYRFSQDASSPSREHSSNDTALTEDRAEDGTVQSTISKHAATAPRDPFDHEAYEEPAEEFKYDQLPPDSKQIRLLSVGPADEHGVVSSVEMHTYELDHAPTFYALSYVWNSTERNVPLTCNGRKLMVTNSLALAHTRSIVWSRGVYLWADGICINQDDVAERNHQVTLMGEIYTRASKVLAHLPHVDQSGDDSQEWSAISAVTLLNRIWATDEDYSAKSEAEWEEILSTNHYNVALWATLLEFWMNRWFTRSWILQEGVLGDSVVVFFGAATCSLNAVTMFWDLAPRPDMPNILKYESLADIYSASRNLSQVRSLKRVREWLQKPSQTGETPDSVKHRAASGHEDAGTRPSLLPNLSLLNLLAMSRSSGATDPRDKVYALLNLADDEVAKMIKPDYSAENTVTKVYIDVAKKYVQQRVDQEIFYHAGIDHLVAGLPSWVPDWSHQTRSTFNHSLYKCSGFSAPRIRAPEPGRLQIRGAIVDSIAYVGFACRYYSTELSLDRLHPMFPGRVHSLPPVNTDRHMRQVVYATGKMFCEKFCNSGRYSEPLDMVLGRTMAADCTRSGQRSDAAFQESWDAYRRHNDSTLEMPELSKKIEPGSAEGRLVEQAWPYEAAMQEVQKGRRICATKGGYLGIATYDTEREDLVVIFEGFSMPFVLRRKGDDYVIVGDAYVHGIMDGELICPLKDEFGLDESQIGVDVNAHSYCIRKPSDGFAVFENLSLV